MSALSEDMKRKVLKIFKEAPDQDISISDVSRRAGISKVTSVLCVYVLEAEGKVEFIRQVGRSKMFKLKRKTSS